MIVIRPRWLVVAAFLVTLAADPCHLVAGETPGKAAQPVEAKVRALVEKAVAAWRAFLARTPAERLCRP
jgi:hypothetical protein